LRLISNSIVDDSSHPICRLPDRSIIHPSIVKERGRARFRCASAQAPAPAKKEVM